MKIGFYGINFAPEPVGIGKYSGEFAHWLSDRNHALRIITAPPYFPEWSIYKQFSNSYQVDKFHGLHVIRCPLWVPSMPTGIKRLLHLGSFALTSLVPLSALRRWRPDVVIPVAPAFFCAPRALLLGRLCGI